MLIVTRKSIILDVVMLDVVMLNVVARNIWGKAGNLHKESSVVRDSAWVGSNLAQKYWTTVENIASYKHTSLHCMH